MRISDWSSDVCSSDLDARRDHGEGGDERHADPHRQAQRSLAAKRCELELAAIADVFLMCPQPQQGPHGNVIGRSRIDQQAFHDRSGEHTSELQSLMRISYAVFCLKKKKHKIETIKR